MTAPQAPAPDDRAAILARAATVVEREDAEARAALARPAQRKKAAIIAVWVLVALNVIAWVLIPPPPLDANDQRTPSAVELDLRLAIAGTATDVDSWRQANAGRLPASLEVAGLAERPFEYAILDATTFTLSGADGPVHLTYRSTTSVAEFLAPGTAAKP